jgi:sigma-54 dependent transcriptional regulator, flagellar regulatory protein
VKGAFTGAMGTRAGRFVSANGGTLFLDEIGDLPLSAQAKLLRVLEERVVSPVGSDADIPVDVRIVAATHRDLEELVAQGKFRADLYFRLAVVPLHLPALRDRGEDIFAIAEIALAKSAGRASRDVTGFDAGARTALRNYNWPGNVRELAHRMERAALLTKTNQISAADLQLTALPRATPPHGFAAVVPPMAASDSGEMPALRDDELDASLDLRKALENLEHTMIARALNKTNGNRTEAAALLGLNRTTLVEKLRKYAI